MYIQEVKGKKEQLQKSIFELLINFQNETDVKVVEVIIQRIDMGPHTPLTDVYVKAEI